MIPGVTTVDEWSSFWPDPAFHLVVRLPVTVVGPTRPPQPAEGELVRVPETEPDRTVSAGLAGVAPVAVQPVSVP